MKWVKRASSTNLLYTHLTLSWRRPLSYRNQYIDLLCKSMDWFLYDRDLRHERVNDCASFLKIILMEHNVPVLNCLYFFWEHMKTDFSRTHEMVGTSRFSRKKNPHLSRNTLKFWKYHFFRIPFNGNILFCVMLNFCFNKDCYLHVWVNN